MRSLTYCLNQALRYSFLVLNSSMKFITVARRPKFKKYFSLHDIEELLREIHTKAEMIAVTSTLDICRDPKDNFLLSLAVDGKATHLLTGDKDLLVLNPLETTQIITIGEYLDNAGSGKD